MRQYAMLCEVPADDLVEFTMLIFMKLPECELSDRALSVEYKICTAFNSSSSS